MKILIDFNHPVHVHLFKNFIKEMKKKGHTFLLIARDRECILELLDNYGLKYIKRKGYTGLLGKSIGMLIIDWKIYRLAQKFKPDIFIGEANPYVAQVGWSLKKPAYIFDDTEHAKLQMSLIKPFATKIITPYCYKKNLGKKQIRYNSFKELAYLHPDYFKPNTKILKRLDINSKEKYFVLRLVNWDANHDILENGIIHKEELIDNLKKYGKVYIISEKELPDNLEQYKPKIKSHEIHDLLYYAYISISEGATVCSESALLGTKSIYCNTLELGYINEISKYGLIKKSNNNKKIIEQINNSLKKSTNKQNWKRARMLLIKEKVNLTKWMIKYIENETK